MNRWVSHATILSLSHPIWYEFGSRNSFSLSDWGIPVAIFSSWCSKCAVYPVSWNLNTCIKFKLGAGLNLYNLGTHFRIRLNNNEVHSIGKLIGIFKKRTPRPNYSSRDSWNANYLQVLPIQVVVQVCWFGGFRMLSTHLS